MDGVGVLPLPVHKTVNGKGVKRPKRERMAVNDHEGRLFDVRHGASLTVATDSLPEKLDAMTTFPENLPPELLERLWANTHRFKAEMGRLGFDIGHSDTPITPVILGDSELTIRFSNRLVDEGVFATSVVFPTVALDRARIRTIVTAAHSDELLDRALTAFATVGRELGVIRG